MRVASDFISEYGLFRVCAEFARGIPMRSLTFGKLVVLRNFYRYRSSRGKIVEFNINVYLLLTCRKLLHKSKYTCIRWHREILHRCYWWIYDENTLKTGLRSLYTYKEECRRSRIDETSLGSPRSYKTVTRHQLYGMSVERNTLESPGSVINGSTRASECKAFATKAKKST